MPIPCRRTAVQQHLLLRRQRNLLLPALARGSQPQLRQRRRSLHGAGRRPRRVHQHQRAEHGQRLAGHGFPAAVCRPPDRRIPFRASAHTNTAFPLHPPYHRWSSTWPASSCCPLGTGSVTAAPALQRSSLAPLVQCRPSPRFRGPQAAPTPTGTTRWATEMPPAAVLVVLAVGRCHAGGCTPVAGE